ncbi:thioredoxin [Halobacteriaceae archaeon GCM10025711]
MSETDDIEEIREQKRKELMDKLERGEDPTAPDPEPEQVVAPDSPIHIESNDQYQDVVDKYDVVVVDFYADWCGPCKMIEPIVKEVAAETDAAVAKVDIDRLQGLAQQNGIRGVPTMFVYADGEPVKRWVGVQDKSTIVGTVQQYS